MPSPPLAWGPLEGKTLCVVELDLSQDLLWAPGPLDAVLRMCIDFCWNSVSRKFNSVPDSSTPKVETFAPLRLLPARDERSVEPIPPAILFTDPRQPGVRLSLGLPSDLASVLVAFTKTTWQQLMGDIALCGIGPFLELYRKGFLTGPTFKREYPLTRWNLWAGTLICVNRPQRTSS